MFQPRRLKALPGQFLRLATLPRASWIEPGRILACHYPQTDAHFRDLTSRGVRLLINLHARSHPPSVLTRHGMTELHLPVPDFGVPTPGQLDAGITAFRDALASKQVVAVHCGAGLGRTGTLLACYFVAEGLSAAEAIARVRAARPGSVETSAQEAAVHEHAQRIDQERANHPQ